MLKRLFYAARNLLRRGADPASIDANGQSVLDTTLSTFKKVTVEYSPHRGRMSDCLALVRRVLSPQNRTNRVNIALLPEVLMPLLLDTSRSISQFRRQIEMTHCLRCYKRSKNRHGSMLLISTACLMQLSKQH